MSKRLSIMKQPVFSVINDHLVDYPSPSNIKCAVVVTISLLGYQATYEKRLTCIGRPKEKGCASRVIVRDLHDHPLGLCGGI